jgi:hypothetical protein
MKPTWISIFFPVWTFLTVSQTTALEKAIQDGWAIDDNDRILLTPQVARIMRDSGAKWVRLHFRLNARHSQWHEPLLAAYQQVVQNLRREKLHILGLVTYESWPGTQAQWIENSAEVHGGNGDNAYIRAFAEKALRTLLAHFPDVTHWEIWNEPNCWTTHPPGNREKLPGQSYVYPSNFAWMLRRSFEEIHRSQRPAALVAGGLLGADFTGNPDADVAAPYLREVFAKGKEFAGWEEIRRRYGTWPADHWGLHLYVSAGSRADADYFAKFSVAFVRALQELEGPKMRKQVWITEVGWATPPNGLSEVDQAANITTMLQVLRAQPQIGPVFYFKLTDEPAAALYYGLLRADGTPKEAWKAFRE